MVSDRWGCDDTMPTSRAHQQSPQQQHPTPTAGYALEALRGQGKIPDPLYRYNELTTRWVAYDTWTWSTTVNAPAALVNASSTFLQLGGVDTFAKVVLNGRVIVQTDNFHRCVSWQRPC
jgi:beta-mannosidase